MICRRLEILSAQQEVIIGIYKGSYKRLHLVFLITRILQTLLSSKVFDFISDILSIQ